MMKSTLIPLEYYCVEAKFQQEQQFLFANIWHFVGFTSQLANNNDYICVNLAGKSVVIRNFNGELKAFHNVCSHRFSLLCREPSGNAPFQCPYHGWAYNKEGVPKGIPGKERFSNIDVEALKLQSFQIDTCGKFVFVNLNSGAISLKDYLGNTAQLLQEFSEAMDSQIDCNEIIIEANWKVIVENTLEDYHVHMVHPSSFYQLGIKHTEIKCEEFHSNTKMVFKHQLQENKKIDVAFDKRPMKIDDYIHQLIFPNLTLASAFGTTFAIQTIVPLAVNKTRFISYVFSTHCNPLSTKDSALIKAFNLSAKEFNRQVFDEDKAICEAVQKGIQETNRKSGVLSTDEERIFAFHQQYQFFSQEYENA
ncbi:MAG: hypothetical protein K0S63_694 [Gammaproteobacteria bacterium]|nr:hypothetical protein [Gammaproteobacteria bacterium]